VLDKLQAHALPGHRMSRGRLIEHDAADLAGHACCRRGGVAYSDARAEGHRQKQDRPP
jgi:hypothetical protein